MDVLARFPAMPAAPPADRRTKGAIEPSRSRPEGKPRPSRPVRRGKSLVPTGSIVVLAVIALGVWGMVLRDELASRKTAPVDVAGAAAQSPHRLAREPGPTSTEARIAE